MGAVAIAGAPDAARSARPRVIFCNDGGTLGAPGSEAPLGLEGFLAASFDMLRGTAVNTVYWQLGTDPFKGTASHRLSDWYSHRTAVGPVWGEGVDRFRTAGEWRIAENARSLAVAGHAAGHAAGDGIGDAVSAVIDRGHAMGLEVLVSLRINDGSDATLDSLDDAHVSPHRRAHPDWLLGDAGHLHPGLSPRQQKHRRFAYDFALPGVRAYTLALVREAIETYALDGFDIDFCRQPSLFRAGAALQQAPLVTAMLHEVRAALDIKSTRAGRRLLLSVRVPHDLEANRLAGLDIAAWLADGLIDILVVSDPAGYNYRLPVEAFVALAGAAPAGRHCQVVAQNLCGFREPPLRSETVLFGTPACYTPAHYRANAALHAQAGADGHYLWNQHLVATFTDAGFVPRHWLDIGDAAALARRDKHYLVGPVGRGGPLPLMLAVYGGAVGGDAVLDVELADDFDTASPPTACLRLMVEQLTALDTLQLFFGAHELPHAAVSRQLNYNDCWLDVEVGHLARRGSNPLRLRVLRRNPHVQAPLVLRAVQVLVHYGGAGQGASAPASAVEARAVTHGLA
ncbi:MAG: hypothetical protein JWP29_5143 [Rhodoferax sp.]|nr:hypothetical protein [Rhodoferax sp.]